MFKNAISVSRGDENGRNIHPMEARVKLRDVIEAIDLSNESWQSYLNPDTGEIVTITDEERDLVEGDADAGVLPR